MEHVLYLISHGLGFVDMALTTNRVLLGVFFLFSGYHKLFNTGRHAGLVETLRACHIPCLGVMQWFVPGVEFMGGIALVFGVLAPLAALGLLVICVVAYCTDGYKKVPLMNPLDKADYLDCVLYVPEVLYGLGLIIAIVAGPGRYALL